MSTDKRRKEAPPCTSPSLADQDHVGRLITLIERLVDHITGPAAVDPDHRVEPAAGAGQLLPANFDWDPTDGDPELYDPEFGAIADRPMVGDAPALETNPFGIPGMSWPPAPPDVVS